MMPRGFIAVLALGLCLAGCGNGTTAQDTAATPAATGPPSAAPPIKSASAPEDPCAWLPAADVERVVGALTGSPTRVRSADSPRPDARGNGCQYALAQIPKIGKGTVTVEVVLNADAIVEDVLGKMGDMFAREIGDGTVPEKKPDSSAGRDQAGWDHAARLPNTFIGRQGHIGVTVSTQTFDVPHDKLAALALVVRNRLPDLPFVVPPDPMLAELAALEKKQGSEPRPHPAPPDACALLTRDEAEAVLGRLMVVPFRSAKNTAFVDPTGASCTYFTANHRALVLTPEWSDGKMLFGMLKAVSGMAGSAVDANAAGSIAQGPWDQAAGEVTGALHFLKGDRLLMLQYRTSSADRDGALRLATLAVNRL